MADSIRLIRKPENVVHLDLPKQNHKKLWPFFIAVSLAIGVASLSYYWFIYSSIYISTDNAYLQADLFPVNSRIMGYVKEVLVQDNSKVKKGDTLVVLDDSDLQIELSFKQAKYDKTLMDVTRARRLKLSHAVSDADLETAEATLVANKADLDGTLAKLKYTRIISPTDGMIGKKNVQSGQFVQPGQGLVVIVSDQHLWVKANYKETQISKIKIGQKAELRFDAYPGHVWSGTVESLFPSSGAIMSLLPPENATGNFTKIVQHIPVKISIDSGQKDAVSKQLTQELRPGMSVYSILKVE